MSAGRDETKVQKTPRLIQDVVSVPRHPKVVTPSEKNRRRPVRLLKLTGLALLLGALGLFVYWQVQVWNRGPISPFSVSISASVNYPLYYPTRLPAGYQIDTASVSSPQQGVFIFYMTGPKGAKLYMSEEARPLAFNFSTFYSSIKDSKKSIVGDHTIVVGRINNNQIEIASWVNHKTWVLSNTTANIPSSQLMSMLNSLTPSH
jgi:hypothetical protein